LENLLNTFAKYDPQIGYVQGMNFIAASLLYHAEEYIAFWILVMIFEIFEMRDIYLPRKILNENPITNFLYRTSRIIKALSNH